METDIVLLIKIFILFFTAVAVAGVVAVWLYRQIKKGKVFFHATIMPDEPIGKQVDATPLREESNPFLEDIRNAPPRKSFDHRDCNKAQERCASQIYKKIDVTNERVEDHQKRLDKGSSDFAAIDNKIAVIPEIDEKVTQLISNMVPMKMGMEIQLRWLMKKDENIIIPDKIMEGLKGK